MNAPAHDNIYLPIRFYEPEAEQRERFIRHCRERMEAEYAAGNREAADNWQQAMFELQHQRDLSVLDRIERQNECYFDAMGEHHARTVRG